MTIFYNMDCGYYHDIFINTFGALHQNPAFQIINKMASIQASDHHYVSE